MTKNPSVSGSIYLSQIFVSQLSCRLTSYLFNGFVDDHLCQFIFLGEIINPAELGSGFDIDVPADIRLEWQGSPLDLVVNISQSSGEFAELSILASIDDENIASLQVRRITTVTQSSNRMIRFKLFYQMHANEFNQILH